MDDDDDVREAFIQQWIEHGYCCWLMKGRWAICRCRFVQVKDKPRIVKHIPIIIHGTAWAGVS